MAATPCIVKFIKVLQAQHHESVSDPCIASMSRDDILPCNSQLEPVRMALSDDSIQSSTFLGHQPVKKRKLNHGDTLVPYTSSRLKEETQAKCAPNQQVDIHRVMILSKTQVSPLFNTSVKASNNSLQDGMTTNFIRIPVKLGSQQELSEAVASLECDNVEISVGEPGGEAHESIELDGEMLSISGGLIQNTSLSLAIVGDDANATSQDNASAVAFSIDSTDVYNDCETMNEFPLADGESVAASDLLTSIDGNSRMYVMITNADNTVSLTPVDPSHIASLVSAGNVPVESPTEDSTSSNYLRKAPLVNVPGWAKQLIDCQQVGNSYRGWVETENDLDVLLTSYKQATHSYWGTRQSPSSSKPSVRLMWKSQFVPFDGIPFLNAGSRAIVMECQYGPRRKNNSKKVSCGDTVVKSFVPTCPARIYIKKVRKFLDLAVDIGLDKKSLKTEMDRAFQLLKDSFVDKPGQDRLVYIDLLNISSRYYVQLPTQAAHEYHDDCVTDLATTSAIDLSGSLTDGQTRLHPDIVNKIRELVSEGETRLVNIRNQLRWYVEKEMFKGSSVIPDRHDLSFYPTVHDVRNHIYQALKDIAEGKLSYLHGDFDYKALLQEAKLLRVQPDEAGANSWDMDMVPIRSPSSQLEPADPELDAESDDDGQDDVRVEVVTLTLERPKSKDGRHRVTRVEVQMNDGTTQVGDSVNESILQSVLSNMPPLLFDPTSSSSNSTAVTHQQSDDEASEGNDVTADCDDCPTDNTGEP